MKLLRKRSLLLSLAATLAISVSSVPSWAAGTLSEKDARSTAESTITPKNLHSYLSFIASDELAGRDTPSVGLNTAARYIATFLERWGFTPKGDNGTFFQKITIRSLVLDGTKSSATVAGKTLRYGSDFLVTGGGDKNPAATPAPMVFAGHGWLIKSKNIDAYKGVDVRGKIVVLTGGRGLPAGIDFRDLSRDGRGTDWMSPEEYAAKNGAVGIIRLPETEDNAAWREGAARVNPIRTVDTSVVGIGEGGNNTSSLPSISLSPETASTLLGGAANLATALNNAKTKTETGAFVIGGGKTATLTVSTRSEDQYTQNVVAVWEGSDATLKNQYVAFGAHYDHVGVNQNPTATGDKIFNGADDDGSGTVALLSIAEALGKQPENRPKRSILFVWHCGEEKGLWGSEYFTSHPTVPESSIVTQLNIDMIGRSKKSDDTNPRNQNLSDTETIYVIGSRMLSTELGEIVDKTNNDYTKLKYDFRYDDPNDPNRFYYRSDHYNYAKHGIPIAFFFDGVHEDYHRPGDEVDKIDFEKYARVTKTIFLTGVAVANRDKAPIVDKK